MLISLAYKLMDALQPVLFPFPANSSIQTPVIRFPLLQYAHRGGGMESVENSLAAFHHAANLKVHVLELDVQATKDNKVVVFHDPTLIRMGGPAYKGKTVRHFTYKDLPQLVLPPHQSPAATTATGPTGPTPQPVQPGLKDMADLAASPAATIDSAVAVLHATESAPQPLATMQQPTTTATAHALSDPHLSGTEGRPASAAAADSHAGSGVHGGEEMARIPLLSEIFERFPDIPIQVDVKVDVPGLVAQVHDQVMSHPHRRQRLLWGSFRHKVQRQLYERDPHIPLFASAYRAIYLRLAHAVGRMKQAHIYESAIIVPWRMPALWGRAKHWYPFLDRSWCEALAARGVAVVYFGKDLNDAHAYATCIQAGASAVCTDRPTLLQSYLADPTSHNLTAAEPTTSTANKPTEPAANALNGRHEAGNGYGSGAAHSHKEPAGPSQPGRVTGEWSNGTAGGSYGGLHQGSGNGNGNGNENVVENGNGSESSGLGNAGDVQGSGRQEVGIMHPMIQLLRVDADALCQHTGSAAVQPCPVCAGKEHALVQ